jgi:plastocyanin
VASFEPAEEAPPDAVTIVVNSADVVFHPDEVTVSSEAAVFFVVHEGPADAAIVDHNIQIGQAAPGPALVIGPTLAPGESSLLTVTGLEPGTYEFWCTVSGHYGYGMVGTLTVTP